MKHDLYFLTFDVPKPTWRKELGSFLSLRASKRGGGEAQNYFFHMFFIFFTYFFIFFIFLHIFFSFSSYFPHICK